MELLKIRDNAQLDFVAGQDLQIDMWEVTRFGGLDLGNLMIYQSNVVGKSWPCESSNIVPSTIN